MFPVRHINVTAKNIALIILRAYPLPLASDLGKQKEIGFSPIIYSAFFEYSAPGSATICRFSVFVFSAEPLALSSVEGFVVSSVEPPQTRAIRSFIFARRWQSIA